MNFPGDTSSIYVSGKQGCSGGWMPWEGLPGSSVWRPYSHLTSGSPRGTFLGEHLKHHCMGGLYPFCRRTISLGLAGASPAEKREICNFLPSGCDSWASWLQRISPFQSQELQSRMEHFICRQMPGFKSFLITHRLRAVRTSHPSSMSHIFFSVKWEEMLRL